MSPCSQGVYSLVGKMDQYTTKSNTDMAVTSIICYDSMIQSTLNLTWRIQEDFIEVNGE